MIGRPSRVKSRYLAASLSDLATCIVVEAELRFGPTKAMDPARQLAAIESLLAQMSILPFDRAAAKEYVVLRTHLERAGAMISPNDLMIAALALAHGLIMVTRYVVEFARAPGLTVEDWEA